MTTETLIAILTSLTGLVGVITGFASVWFGYLSYFRDNAKVKVKAFKKMNTITPGVGSSEKTYLVINVANAGRRPVIVNKAAFVSLKSRGGGISSSSMMYGNQKLSEGKAIDYMMEDEDIDYSDVSHVSVYDSIGNEYRCYLTPWYRRFFYWFLDVTYLKRKPTQAPKKKQTKYVKR